MENGIQYEIINKETGVSYLATQIAFGDSEVTVSTVEVGDVSFTHNNDGVWSNDQYVARDVETKLSPDGVTPVADVVVENTATETVVEETTETTETVA